MNRPTSGFYGWRETAGAVIVLLSRIAIAPRTFWEHDELLFAAALRDFNPRLFHPHPPGYPLYVLVGKLVNAVVRDEFHTLVAISVVSCVAGFVAVARLFRLLLDDEDSAAVSGALIVFFSAAMLVHSVLPMSDAAAFAAAMVALLAITRGDVLVAAIAASCAIGFRPQLVVPLAPALLVAFARMRGLRERVACLAAFTATSLVWFVPLVVACGGFTQWLAWERSQAAYVVAHDAAASRGALSAAGVATRFLLHPWGPKVITLPLLVVFAIGLVAVVRRRSARMLPLVVFSVAQIAFELLSMDPADAARYAMPSLPLVALIVVCGLAAIHRRIAPPLGAAAFACLSLWYVWPLVAERVTSPSPPAAAAAYANRSFAPGTIVLYDASVRPHAEFLLPRFHPQPLEPGLRAYFDRPDVPLVIFASGGSRQADARTFAWPPSDAYGKLTRNFYRVVTLDPLRAEERYLPVSGVYALERNVDGEEWRWLARDARIRLPRAHGAHATLTLALSPDAPYDANDITIFVNNVEAAKATVRRAGTNIEIPLPPSDSSTRAPEHSSTPSNTELRIVSARSFQPSQVLHNRDTRALATQLTACETGPR